MVEGAEVVVQWHCRGLGGRQQDPGLGAEGWLSTRSHGFGTHLEFAQEVRDPEGAVWRMYTLGCACCQDPENEKGLVEEERLRDCPLLGLRRWHRGRQVEWAL